MAADEVAQVYLSPADGNKNIRPIQLQGFSRVSLKPGESKKISVKMYTEQLGFYTNDGQRQWNIQPGKYIIKIGASSQDIKLQQQINLSGEAVKMPLRKYYFSEAKQI
jgi:beta-glucosidase